MDLSVTSAGPRPLKPGFVPMALSTSSVAAPLQPLADPSAHLSPPRRSLAQGRDDASRMADALAPVRATAPEKLTARARRIGEISLPGTYSAEGTHAGARYRGELTIKTDGTYELGRQLDDGRHVREVGRVGFDTSYLVLTPAVGEPRTLKRTDHDDRVHFVATPPPPSDSVRYPAERESELQFVVRVLTQGKKLRWLFVGNRSAVDRDGGRHIIRSMQPTPNTLEYLRDRKGLKTVLSLNGDQNEEAWYHPDRSRPRSHSRHRRHPPPVRVNQREFIDELGLEHHHVSLSSGRIPTDEELVNVFRVLLDPSKHPVLLHCRGGADRTGLIAALYRIEFLGISKEQALEEMREHFWGSDEKTWILGAYIRMYQRGSLTWMLESHGVEVPAALRP